MNSLRRRAWAALAAGAAGASLAGCGGYVLHGRVIQGDWSTAAIVADDDPRLAERGLSGATIVLRRDPMNMNAHDAAQAVSGIDGHFSLHVSEFGAGWMEEQWLVRAQRAGTASAEALLTLPAKTAEKLLLIELGPDDSGPSGVPGASETDPWHEDYKRHLERFR